jgi:hypothetical protein
MYITIASNICIFVYQIYIFVYLSGGISKPVAYKFKKRMLRDLPSYVIFDNADIALAMVTDIDTKMRIYSKNILELTKSLELLVQMREVVLEKGDQLDLNKNLNLDFNQYNNNKINDFNVPNQDPNSSPTHTHISVTNNNQDLNLNIPLNQNASKSDSQNRNNDDIKKYDKNDCTNNNNNNNSNNDKLFKLMDIGRTEAWGKMGSSILNVIKMKK